MFIKICGLTIPEQAKEIASYGATHLGVIHFPKSPRHLEFSQIKKIKEIVPAKTKVVAVVVNPSIKKVNQLLEIVDMVQFHGEEPIDFVKNFPKERVIKAFRIKDEKSINQIKPFIDEDYLILIDAYKEGEYGGTGKQIDVELAKKISNLTDKLILSGGLSPKNLDFLLEEIKPFGVDASSKLEIKPGIKDLEKTKKFIKIAKKYYESVS